MSEVGAHESRAEGEKEGKVDAAIGVAARIYRIQTGYQIEMEMDCDESERRRRSHVPSSMPSLCASNAPAPVTVAQTRLPPLLHAPIPPPVSPSRSSNTRLGPCLVIRLRS